MSCDPSASRGSCSSPSNRKDSAERAGGEGVAALDGELEEGALGSVRAVDADGVGGAHRDERRLELPDGDRQGGAADRSRVSTVVRPAAGTPRLPGVVGCVVAAPSRTAGQQAGATDREEPSSLHGRGFRPPHKVSSGGYDGSLTLRGRVSCRHCPRRTGRRLRCLWRHRPAPLPCPSSP